MKKAQAAGNERLGPDVVAEANRRFNEDRHQEALQMYYGPEAQEVSEGAESTEFDAWQFDDNDGDSTYERFQPGSEVPEVEPISEEVWRDARSLFGFQRITEYGTAEPGNYLVDRLLVIGQPGIICAPHKCLKTTLSIDLAISLASGTKFLGYFDVPKRCRVCLMTGESGEKTVSETVERICKAKGIKRSELEEWLAITNSIPKLYEPKSMGRLQDCIELLRPEVLILDPIYKMMKGDNASNLFAMGEQLAVLSELGCTVIVNHHVNAAARKAYKPLDLEAPAFSGFAEYFRQWILLNRREAFKPGTGHHKIWLSFGGSAGQSGLLELDLDEGPNTALVGRSYRLKIEPVDNSLEDFEPDEAPKEPRKDGLLAELKKHLTGSVELSRTRLAALLRRNPTVVKELLEREVAAGKVKVREGKSGKQTCELYSWNHEGQ
jgi:hypothetical protein